MCASFGKMRGGRRGTCCFSDQNTLKEMFFLVQLPMKIQLGNFRVADPDLPDEGSRGAV